MTSVENIWLGLAKQAAQNPLTMDEWEREITAIFAKTPTFTKYIISHENAEVNIFLILNSVKKVNSGENRRSAPCKVCIGVIYKIHNFFIDFYFPFVYDNIAKYGMLYFVRIPANTAFLKENIMKEVFILWQILI